jgi:hypothetical protein
LGADDDTSVAGPPTADALEVSTLILAAQRLDNLIHHRRAKFAAKATPFCSR